MFDLVCLELGTHILVSALRNLRRILVDELAQRASGAGMVDFFSGSESITHNYFFS